MDLAQHPITIAGRQYWYVNGKVRPHVAGGSDIPTPPPAPDPVTPPPAPVDTKAIAFAARKEATDKLIADLGYDPKEAKAILDQVKAAGDAQKSETQRALEAAHASRTAADQALADAKSDRLAAKLERALMAEGVPVASLARASRTLSVDPDADDGAIAAEIAALKTELPGLFTGTATVPPPAVAKAATPPAATGLNGKTFEAAGREAAAQFNIPVRPVTAVA